MYVSDAAALPHDMFNRAYFWRKCTIAGQPNVVGRFLMAHSSIENRKVHAYVEMEDGQVMMFDFEDIQFVK